MKDPREYLLPSHMIEVSVEGLDTNLRTLIEQGVEENQFRILAPMLDGKIFLFSEITAVDVLYTYKDGTTIKVVQFPCKIVKKGLVDNIPVVTLRIVGEAVYAERRKAFRVDITTPMMIKSNEKMIQMTTKDISLSGMMGYIPVRLSVGEKISILWHFDIGDSILSDRVHLEKIFEVYEEDKENNYENEAIRYQDFVEEAEEDAEAYIKNRELQKIDDSCFIIDATVIACEYKKQMRNYELRIRYNDISEKKSKRILTYLYKKQAEIISSDPILSSKIDSYFSNSNAELPLPMAIPIITMISVFITLIAVVFYMLAVPEGSSFLDLLFNVHRVAVWNTAQLRTATILELVALIQELTSFALKLRLVLLKKNHFKIAWLLVPALEGTFLVYMFLTLIGN